MKRVLIYKLTKLTQKAAADILFGSKKYLCVYSIPEYLCGRVG